MVNEAKGERGPPAERLGSAGWSGSKGSGRGIQDPVAARPRGVSAHLLERTGAGVLSVTNCRKPTESRREGGPGGPMLRSFRLLPLAFAHRLRDIAAMKNFRKSTASPRCPAWRCR